jgi:hypothetical protein
MRSGEQRVAVNTQRGYDVGINSSSSLTWRWALGLIVLVLAAGVVIFVLAGGPRLGRGNARQEPRVGAVAPDFELQDVNTG